MRQSAREAFTTTRDETKECSFTRGSHPWFIVMQQQKQQGHNASQVYGHTVIDGALTASAPLRKVTWDYTHSLSSSL